MIRFVIFSLIFSFTQACGNNDPDYYLYTVPVWTDDDGNPSKETLRDAVDYWLYASGDYFNFGSGRSLRVFKRVREIRFVKADDILLADKNVLGFYSTHEAKIVTRWLNNCYENQVLFHELMHHVHWYVFGIIDNAHREYNDWEAVKQMSDWYIPNK